MSPGRGRRIDRKLAGLLLLLVVGCLSLAVERRRARLVWSELPGAAVAAQTAGVPSQGAGKRQAGEGACLEPESGGSPAGGRPSAAPGGEGAEAAEGRKGSAVGGEVLDLNRATARELEALPGIGPALARRILAYRESHGPFRRVEDLQKVSGIGPARLARLAGLVGVREETGVAP